MGKGHRKTRLSSRKNYERQKHKNKLCRVSVSTVAIQQIDNDETVASDSEPMVVSMPITSFQEADIDGLENLRTRLVELNNLPTGNNCNK